jgi:hypothetical protein
MLTAPIDAPDRRMAIGPRAPRAAPLLETSSDAVATTRQHDAPAPFSDRQRTRPSPTIESIRALTQAASTTAAPTSHDVLGLEIGAGRSGSSPTSAIGGSQRAARRRQRDDLIALPTTWVIARIAARAT